MRASAFGVALLLLGAHAATAQVLDSFSDGDFLHDPAWTGALDRWTVDDAGGQLRLRADGAARRDTIHLATASPAAFGAWTFTFAYEGVNLSTFNGARVYLVADAADLRGPVRGYFLQFGTNNLDEIRLYRQDGSPENGRVELARSLPLLAADSAVIHVSATRSPDGAWTVRSDDVEILTARDGTYGTGAFFGFWVKHTEDARRAFFFDDLAVTADTTRPDREPPAVQAVAYDPAALLLRITFSEPLDPSTVTPSVFEVEGVGPPITAVLAGASTVVLAFAAPLPPGHHRLRLHGLTDAAGNPIPAGTEAAFDVEGDDLLPPEPGSIVINELLFDPPEDVPEFIELFNRTDQPFDLRALALSDDRRRPVALARARTLLEPGSFAVFTADSAAFAAAFPDVPVRPLEPWPALNNTGDTVVLTAGEREVDAVAYAGSWSSAGRSLERVDPDGPSDSRRNFGPSTDPRGATPGATNARYAPDHTPPSLRFVEAVGDGRLGVYFDEPVAAASLAPAAFLLEGHPALAVAAATDTTCEVRFGPPAGGGTLTVLGLRDLTGNTRPSQSAVVAAQAGPGDVYFNEVLFAPRADPSDALPDQPEYAEVASRAGGPVSLRGWYWTGPPDEHGVADTLDFDAGLGALPPGGYALVYADPRGSAGPSLLAGAFPDAHGAGVVLLPLRRASLGLPNTRGRFVLHRRDGLVLDTLTYDAGWHDPALATSSGISLERVSPDGLAGNRTNWASSRAPAGGTPGGPNTVAPVPGAVAPAPGSLVVNEILYEPIAAPDDGRPDQPEFVELFNRSADVLELDGLYWTGAPDEAGRADTLRFAASPAALPPGGYVLVWSTPSSASPAAFLQAAYPAAPATGAVLLAVRAAGLGLTNAGGLLRLHRPDGVLLDEVPYAPSHHHPNLRTTAGVSLERIDPGIAPSASNWSSSVDPAGATPGYANSLLRQPGEGGGAGVVVEPSPFSIERDGVARIRYRLRGEAGLVRARIFDAGGRLVRTLREAHLGGASGLLQWDGLDDEGRRPRTGIYVVFLEAVDTAAGTTEAYKTPFVFARPFE